jgi:pilus assembly protein Flp/PilA
MFARINEALLARVAALQSQDEGQTMAEYGLLLALIAVVVATAALTLGPAIRDMFTQVENNL